MARRLRKAQQAFQSAEALWNDERTDCAANRYYYALVHVIRAYIGETPRKLFHRDYLERMKAADRESYRVMGLAYAERVRADYTPHPVKPGRLARFRCEEARAICRAMDHFAVGEGSPAA